MFAERFYYRGSRPKPAARGMLHKMVLVLSPLWGAHLTPARLTQCSGFFYCLYVLPWMCMFASSVWYHHYERPSRKYHEWACKVDMSFVGLAVLSNLIPTLVFLEMKYELFVFVALVLLTVALLVRSHEAAIKKIFCAGVVLVVLYIVFGVIPRILTRMPGIPPMAVLGLVFILVTLLGQFVYSDEDAGQRSVRSHDLLHWQSVALAAFFVAWNQWLVDTYLCGRQDSNIHTFHEF